jgi:DNA-binding transcriptional LysR family regulator
MDDLNDLYFFAKVAEHRGFASAGRVLATPKSTLSRRIASLEQRLGVRLLHRTARKFSLTEVGQIYYRHCLAMLAEAEAAQEAIDRTRAEPRGMVRVSCPATLMQTHLSGIVSIFLAANPLVKIHLIVTNRRVDLIEEGIDVAFRVRFQPPDDGDFVVKSLGESSQVIVGHPRLLNHHGRPADPSGLSRLPGMDLIRSAPTHVWELIGLDGSTLSTPFEPRYFTDDFAALRQAALDAVGVVQLPEILVRQDIVNGLLEEVLPNWKPRAGIIYLVFPSRRGLVPAVRGFVDFVGHAFSSGTNDAKRRA